MAYVNYNRAIYRTGFRPYGQTNPWAASQLNGLSIPDAALSGYLGQTHPFGPWELHTTPTHYGRGWLHGIGQSHPFTDAGGWRLHGLGESAICLDQSENTVPCSSPECTYGDCGAKGPQVTSGPLCLDESQNAVACADPMCKYGDCIAPVTLPPGPAGRVNVPISQFPQTSQRTMSTVPPQQGTVIKGIPDIAIYGFAALALVAVVGGGGRRR